MTAIIVNRECVDSKNLFWAVTFKIINPLIQRYYDQLWNTVYCKFTNSFKAEHSDKTKGLIQEGKLHQNFAAFFYQFVVKKKVVQTKISLLFYVNLGGDLFRFCRWLIFSEIICNWNLLYCGLGDILIWKLNVFLFFFFDARRHCAHKLYCLRIIVLLKCSNDNSRRLPTFALHCFTSCVNALLIVTRRKIFQPYIILVSL